MPPRDWRLRVKDILEAIAEIQSETTGMTLETFGADRRTVRSVAYSLTVIGEAARRVPDSVQIRYPDIPWAAMSGLRNVLVHEYFGIELTVIWSTILVDLPMVRLKLAELLDQET